MERSTMLLMGKSTISMVIFNSYFDITRGYIQHGQPALLADSSLHSWQILGTFSWPMELAGESA